MNFFWRFHFFPGLGFVLTALCYSESIPATLDEKAEAGRDSDYVTLPARDSEPHLVFPVGGTLPATCVRLGLICRLHS